MDTDSRFVEVKAAAGGFPKSIRETISAFSNSAGGGLVLLGLDERTGFELADGFDAGATVEAAIAMVRSRKLKEESGPLTPTPVVDDSIAPFEGGKVVILEVSELEPHQKPCFVTDRGSTNGSFRRLHDGDHRLNEFEVYALQSNQKQPRDDVQPVEGASLTDLDCVSFPEPTPRRALRVERQPVVPKAAFERALNRMKNSIRRL